LETAEAPRISAWLNADCWTRIAERSELNHGFRGWAGILAEFWNLAPVGGGRRDWASGATGIGTQSHQSLVFSDRRVFRHPNQDSPAIRFRIAINVI